VTRNKIWSVGVYKGSELRDLLLNFGTPLISPERLELEISHFVCTERARGLNQKYAN